MRTRLVLAVAVVGLVFASDAQAQAVGSMPESNKAAAQAARDVIAVGVPMFNGGDASGCFRLYQGALLAIKPAVAGNKELAVMIDAKLAAAASATTPGDKAFALRSALDSIVKIGSDPGKKPLWDRLGGEPAVRLVTQEFLKAAAADKRVKVDRNGNYPLTKERVGHIEQLVVEFISSVTGGPLKYTGRDMKNAHQGMAITEAEFNAAAEDLIAVLKKANVPQAEIDEFVGLVAGTAKDIIEVKK